VEAFFKHGCHEFVGDSEVEMWKLLVDFESESVSRRDVETLCSLISR
jgi:hypothetical protein